MFYFSWLSYFFIQLHKLVEFINEKGVFLINGMVEKVAEKMEILKITVCSYLD
ncbi:MULTISPECIES: helix-turn-helix domain-containing protein [unclassified Clostridium]|uniref:helix-turn-helix domain-containing protein n=1 Tax=unclassified Clostridium TaxID=2614128 RepID=UPI0037C0E09D